MAPTAALFGLWDEGENFEPEVVVDCLLPTGIMIPLQVRKECTLAEIKEVSLQRQLEQENVCVK